MLTPHQQKLVALWERHTEAEFLNHNVDETMKTMTDHPHVHNIPVMIGGEGVNAVRDFYANRFLNGLPPIPKRNCFHAPLAQTRLLMNSFLNLPILFSCHGYSQILTPLINVLKSP